MHRKKRIHRIRQIIKQHPRFPRLQPLRDFIFLLSEFERFVAVERDLAHAEVGPPEIEGEEGAGFGAVGDAGDE